MMDFGNLSLRKLNLHILCHCFRASISENLVHFSLNGYVIFFFKMILVTHNVNI